MSKDCIFCKIRDGEIPKEFIYEDDLVLSFDDINPKAPVHILVVAREHIPSVMHLTQSHKELVFSMLEKAKNIAADKGLKGYKLVFNVGREGGQVIDHIHLHILGGWNNG